jgi:Na+-transporting methylmalonyl-CoA/oxaloacetate decarboxylase gamma subunit
MAFGTALVLWLLMMAVFFYVLYLVVRAAVEEAIRRAVPHSLLRPSTQDLIEQQRQQRDRQRVAGEDPHPG